MKQDFLDAVSSLVGRLMEDSIHTSAPSKVGKVENNHTAKLTPNLKVTTDDGREVPYPEISGTIILMPCGAGGTVGFAFPVNVRTCTVPCSLQRGRLRNRPQMGSFECSFASGPLPVAG